MKTMKIFIISLAALFAISSAGLADDQFFKRRRPVWSRNPQGHHEFGTIPGVLEDRTDMILNVQSTTFKGVHPCAYQKPKHDFRVDPRMREKDAQIL